MPHINVLPKHIADLIAAGEVVERPAAAVKELLENSIDAGASSVTLEIKNGGKTYIRVTDNGCGISRADIRNAFASHATSKISVQEDLDRIMTLGFRGEALSSICAVSRVDILTRTSQDENGTRYSIEGGAEKLLDDAGCPVGTTIVVRDIFYNVPARMKFLNKDAGEGNKTAAVVEKIALSHPDTAFRFIRDGKQVFSTTGDGSLANTIHSLFGRELSDGLCRVDSSLGGIDVSGYVSLPTCPKGSRANQHFFVNSRCVKSITVMTALEAAYNGALGAGKFPAAVLFVDVPPETVDVNVHPSKTEVRFQDEKRVFDCVYGGVRNAVEKNDVIPEAPLSKAAMFAPVQEAAQQLGISQPPVKITCYGTPVTGREDVLKSPEPGEKPYKSEPKVFDFLDDSPLPVLNVSTVSVTARAPVPDEPAQPEPQPISVTVLGEVYNTYILCVFEGELYICDKHAAHERIVYNELKAGEGAGWAQQLLVPVAVRLSAEEYEAITGNLALLAESGYDISDFGDMTVTVRSCPSALDSEDIEELICELAGYLSISGREPVPKRLEHIYASTACRAAVKAGDRLSEAEQRALMLRVFSDDNVRHCPHGRPVAARISRAELEKLFLR